MAVGTNNGNGKKSQATMIVIAAINDEIAGIPIIYLCERAGKTISADVDSCASKSVHHHIGCDKSVQSHVASKYPNLCF